jgi:hypothetical protein
MTADADKERLKAAKRAIFAWVNKQKLKTTPKAVLKVLAEYADVDGKSFHGQTTICERVGCSKSTLKRTLVALENEGRIRRQHRYDGRGKRTSDDIWLLYLELPLKMSPSDPTTAQNDVDYSSNCTSLGLILTPESNRESTDESFPLIPKGEQEEKSDWDSGKKGRRAFKMYPGTPGFDRWCGYYRACGNEDRVSEAVRLGYIAGTTTYPPTVGAGQQSNREASA